MPAKKTPPAKEATPAPKKAASTKAAPAKKTAPKKAAPAKKTAPAKKAAPEKKVSPAKKVAPTSSLTPAKKNPPKKPASGSAAAVWRLKVLCIAGPYWDSDDVCVRTIDVLDTCSLYDLHAAILESVHFEEHEESVFTFFTAMDFRGRRTYLGDSKPLTHETDIEAFEDIPLATALPSGGRQFLYYVFDADDPWVFLIGREPAARVPSPHEFYPSIHDELNRGPDPIQYGDGLDDFADADEGEEFNELREDFRRRRREREESGLDDDELDDDESGVPGVFPGSDDGSDYDEDDEENRDPYSGGYGDDDDRW